VPRPVPARWCRACPARPSTVDGCSLR
jgi:hypothetical protein